MRIYWTGWCWLSLLVLMTLLIKIDGLLYNSLTRFSVLLLGCMHCKIWRRYLAIAYVATCPWSYEVGQFIGQRRLNLAAMRIIWKRKKFGCLHSEEVIKGFTMHQSICENLLAWELLRFSSQARPFICWISSNKFYI